MKSKRYSQPFQNIVLGLALLVLVAIGILKKESITGFWQILVYLYIVCFTLLGVSLILSAVNDLRKEL